jgi:hypothetical protein
VPEKSGKKLGRKYGPLDFAAGIVAFLLMGATVGPLSEPETVPKETWPFLYMVWAVLTPLLIGLVILMRKNR